MSFTKKQYFIKFLCLNWAVIVLMIALVATARTNAFLYTSYFFVFWTVYVLFTLKSGEQKKFTPKKYLVIFLGSNLAYLGGGLSVIAGELNLFPNGNFYDFLGILAKKTDG